MRVMLLGTAALVLAGLVAWTSMQIAIWNDSDTLWLHALSEEPSPLAHQNLGRAAAERGDVHGAIEYFAQALRLDPGDAEVTTIAGAALLTLGQADDAIEHFRAALVFHPGFEAAVAGFAKRWRDRDLTPASRKRTPQLNVRDCLVMFRRSFSILVCAAGLLPAQTQVGKVEVLVSPDRPDWKYSPGEKVTFTIHAVRNGADIQGAQVSYAIGPEMMPATITRTAALGRDGLRVDGGTMNAPGFLRCTARVEQDGYTYQGLATAGFSPESIQPVVRDPEDFDAFWQAGKDELSKVPLDAIRTLVPELSTAKVNVYHVSLQNVGRARVFGMLAEPKAPGRYPAILGVPGAGVSKVPPMIQLAEQGAITLNIGIHGIPLTLDPSVYALLAGGALNGYWAYNLDSRDRYYYRRVYLGCLRANDYLTSLEEWNGRDLAVTGGSQGGALSIVTAGLDPRVKALAASYPALSDMAGYTEGRAGGWPHVFRNAGPGSNRTREKLETAAYYDVVNFARRVKAAGIYTWGYNDTTCPPTSTYAAYNVIHAPKQLVLALETGHGRVPEQTDVLSRWLENFVRHGYSSVNK